ncbi:MAG: amino acid adenylation domain-containing protein, partial [Clostridium sp.]
MAGKVNSKIEGIYSLTPMQEGMLFHKLLDKESTNYFVQQVLKFYGNIDIEKIKVALNFLQYKYEVLRTVILHSKVKQPRQVVLKERDIEIIEIDISDDEDKEARLEAIRKSDINRGFDLEKDTLMRVIIIKSDENDYRMIWSFHHIIMDGWCMSIIFKDFLEYYTKLKNGITKEAIIREINNEKDSYPKYSEYIKWIEKQDKIKGLNYWKELLNEYDEVVEIKGSKNIEKTNEQVKTVKLSLNEELSEKVREYSSKRSVTINSVVEAAWGVLLQKYSGSKDVVFGKVVSGRNADIDGIDSMVGLFINTIPVRITSSIDKTFDSLLNDVQEQSLNSMKYDYCPLAEIQNKAFDGKELFKTLIAFENYYVDEEGIKTGLQELSFEIEKAREQTNYPITMTIFLDKKLGFSIMYDTTLYNEEDILLILKRLEKIISTVVNEPNKLIKDISIVTEEEEKILELYNDTNESFSFDKSVQELFEEQVRKTPNKIAVRHNDNFITYSELNNKANKLARILRNKGIKKNEYVIIMTSRSIEMIVAVLGAIKSGAAYVPVDINYPNDRIEYIIDNCNAKAIVTNVNDKEINTTVTKINICELDNYDESEENLEIINSLDDIFYLIYTSGSTGRPKGVIIDQRGAYNTIIDINRRFQVNSKDNILGVSSLCFDLSVYDIFGSLLEGATLVILNDQRDIAEIKKKIDEYEITIWNSVPAIIELLVEDLDNEYSNNKLRKVLLSGDWIPINLNDRIKSKFKNAEVISLGGATEASIWSIHYPIKEVRKEWNSIPYGIPLSNQKIYILDENMNQCAINIKGEIYIGGIGVAKGYMNDNQKNEEHFINHPKYGYIYRTGDYGVFTNNGYVEFIGRKDSQVKINGFRIELGEIESVINKHKDIQNSAVIVENNNICAYIVSNKTIEVENFRNELRQTLTEYMIPTYIMQVEKIPLTANGKLDRKSLPKIEINNKERYLAPRNDLERTLVQVFERVLSIKPIGINDNFFELGGDSIKAIRVVSQVREEGYEVSVKDIMQYKTINKIKDKTKAILLNVKKYEQGEVVGEVPLTPIQKEFNQWDIEDYNHFNQSIMVKSKKFNERALKATLKEIVIHHDELRAVFRENKEEILPVKESKLFDFYVNDFRNINDDELISKVLEESNKIQASINLTTGPLVKVCLFKTKNDEHLLIVIHHLVMDGVSWRIILEDLQNGYTQYLNEGRIKLPLKTASYKEWAEALEEFKDTPKLAKEKEYWTNVCNRIEEAQLNGDVNGEKVFDKLAVQLEKETTDKLLYKACKAYNTQINDLLLTALVIAAKKTTNQNMLSVKLESHGREQIHKEVVIDRTIGWFTSIYPLILNYQNNIEDNIIETKEILRRVPNNGIGYGVLKYDSKNNLNNTDVNLCFNYLGDINNMLSGEGDNVNNYISISNLPTGEASKGNANVNNITFNEWIVDGKLQIDVSFNKGKYSFDYIQNFVNAYVVSLNEVICQCMDKEEITKTASDFGLLDMSKEEFKEIQKNIDINTIENIYSLTPMQEGMLYHRLLDSKSTNYFVQHVLKFNEKLELENIKSAFSLLSKKYDVLRTAILYKNLTKPRQVVYNDRDIEISIIDLSLSNDKNEKIEKIKKDDINRGFDLEKDSLMRATIIKTSEEEYRLVWSFHHIIMDGWCISLLISDFLRFYKELNSGLSVKEVNNNIIEERKEFSNYRDYVKWLENQNKNEALAYWKDLLEDYDNVAEIKSLGLAEKVDEQVRTLNLQLSEKVSNNIKEFSKEENVTINTIVECAWGILLQRYTRSQDVVFGKVVSGRNANILGIENMVGLFINTIPMRIKTSDDITCENLIKNTQEQSLKGMKYDFYSIAELQKESVIQNELIKTLLVFENYYINEEGLSNSVESINMEMEGNREQTNYPITLNVSFGKTLNISIMYSTDLYTKEEIVDVLERLEKVLCQITDKQKLVKDISLLRDIDKKNIKEFNKTDVDYCYDKCIFEKFEEQVLKTPNNVAVCYENNVLTYKQLNERANSLARMLREKGVKPNDFVAIEVERSIEMIVGIYGIIKSGAAYVPIDKTFPKERKTYILDDCKARIILTKDDKFDLKKDIININLCNDEVYKYDCTNLESVNKPEDLIYLIYTSGTTGKPKGVMSTHKGCNNRITWMQSKYPINEEDTILQKTTYTFDVSVWEIFWWSQVGAKVKLLKVGGEKDPAEICNTIKNSNITVLHFVPSMLRAMLRYLEENTEKISSLKSIRNCFTSGEALKIEDLKMFNELIRSKNKDSRLINLYGPTEASIDVTYFDCEYDYKKLPIGKPISNTRIYIVNNNELCGISLPGELCIAGDGLAKGYLNREELNKEKFIDNSFINGERIYRTGDLARWLPDGNIEYLGRIDEQVKIRGYRIELGEIESLIRNQKNIQNVAVTVSEDEFGVKNINAYLVAKEKLDINEVKKDLRKELPEYMLPKYIMQIEEIPVTISGKVNKRLLPKIQAVSLEEYIAPKNELEEKIERIFSSVLGVERVGTRDNFFELGGDSIKAIRVISQVREIGYELDIKTLMQERSIENIVPMLKKTDLIYSQKEVTGIVPFTPIQKDFVKWNLKKPSHFNQGVMIKADSFDKEALKEALKEIVKHHDMLRTVLVDSKQKILSIDESKLVDIKFINLVDLDESKLAEKIKEEANKVNSEMNLENGPLIKAALFKTKKEEHLLLIIHHLVVDGVSWRIILEDLENGYNDYINTGKITLPLKTASFKEWAEALEEYKYSKKLTKEKEYWNNVLLDLNSSTLPKLHNCNEVGVDSVSFELDNEKTKKLLYSSSKAYNTQINDLLLTSLVMAITKYTGKEKVGVAIEGHGREEFDKPIKIDRTVGWFTSVYPVVLRIGKDIEETIITTKEMLRRVPNNGIGYGSLAESNEESLNNIVDICFNYLGDFSSNEINSKSKISTSEYSVGETVAKENGNIYAININLAVYNNGLNVGITFDKSKYNYEFIKEIARLYLESLEEVINYCANKEEIVKTQSDFNVFDMDNNEFEKIKEKYNIENISEIFSLTSMQEGMLYHKLLDNKATSYIIQHIYKFDGNLNIGKLKESIEIISEKYKALQTAIVYKNLKKPRQVVLNNRIIEFNLLELGDSNLEDIRNCDINRGFDLENDSLMRITLVKVAENKYNMIWTFHHIIMDGWCLSLVFGDLIRYYGLLISGKSKEQLKSELNKEKIGEYSQYVQWLEKQDKEEALTYFKQLLNGYDEIAEIRPLNIVDKPKKASVETSNIAFSRDISNSLKNISAKENITINTIVETIWGILLQKYNNSNDVVFGKVVSGRNADIPGIEKAVGLFINTIPIRVENDENITFKELLYNVQNQSLESMKYDYCSLAEINKISGINDLFKTLFVFENYYVNEENIETGLEDINIEIEKAREETNYPITVTASFNSILTLSIMYDPSLYEEFEIENI